MAGRKTSPQVQSKPLSGTVQVLSPPPKVSRKNLEARVSDLGITFTGGRAGSPAKVTFAVTLNTTVAAQGTAELVDEDGSSPPMPATKTTKGYVFKNVEFTEPGPAKARVFRITNVRVNASALSGGSAAGATPVIASVVVSTPGSSPIRLSGAQQSVALITQESAVEPVGRVGPHSL